MQMNGVDLEISPIERSVGVVVIDLALALRIFRPRALQGNGVLAGEHNKNRPRAAAEMIALTTRAAPNNVDRLDWREPDRRRRTGFAAGLTPGLKLYATIVK